jgi:hypothetical protein
MPSKEWHMRASWALDELAGELWKHFDYPDKTALVKGLVRYCALVDKSKPHGMTARLAREPAWVQDKIDAEILRMWRAGEHLHGQMLEKLIAETRAAGDGVALAEGLIRKAKT